MARRRPRFGPRSRTGSYAPQLFRSALSTGANVATAESTEAEAIASAAEYRDWAARGNRNTRCVLVELDFMAEVDGAPVLQTLYFSDRVFFDDVTNRSYVDVVKNAPQYARSLSGDGLGTYVSTIGQLDLDNADGQLDFLRDLALDGSQIRFYYGDVTWPVADFELIFAAIASKVTAPALDRMVLQLKDAGLLLDKRIGGVLLVGGTGPNVDRPKPVNVGYIHNLTPMVQDETVGGGLYVHSYSETGTAAVAVRDRGVPVAFTDNANGTFTLTSPPDGLVTCDVLAEPFGTGSVDISDAMFYLIGKHAGIYDANLWYGAGPTFTVHDVDDYAIGISMIESRNAVDLLADITESGNCFWAINRAGLFTYGRLRLNDIASFGLDARTIYEDDYDNGAFSLDHVAPQYYKYQATMSRNWTKQSDLAASLSPDEQALFTRNGLYVAQPDAAGTAYLDRPEFYHKTLAVSPVIDTLISKEFAVDDVDELAQWMTTRRAMQLPWIEIVKMTVGVEWFELELGDPVILNNPRFGEDEGVLFQVIGITINLTAAKCELTLARRNVIQEVPESWRRQASVIDDVLEFSGADLLGLPDPITLVDLGVDNLIPPPGVTIVRPSLPNQHPDVLLWVPFTDGTAADRSSYNRTPVPVFDTGEATVTTAGLVIDRPNAAGTVALRINYLIQPTYTSIPTSVPLTFEWFITWYSNGPQSVPGEMIHFDPSPTVVSVDIRKVALSGTFPISGGDFMYDDSDFGIQAGPTTGDVLNPSGTRYHMAWVIPAGTSVVDHFYCNGVERLTYSRSRLSLSIAADGQFSIGGLVSSAGSPATNTRYTVGEVRVTRRNLYPSGTTFTPPTMGALPPIT